MAFVHAEFRGKLPCAGRNIYLRSWIMGRADRALKQDLAISDAVNRAGLGYFWSRYKHKFGGSTYGQTVSDSSGTAM
jgi:hypothetical protein